MKKLLLSAMVALGAIFTANSQTTIYGTNFPNAAIPAGWSQQKANADPTNLGWQFNSVVLPGGGQLATQFMAPSGLGDFAFINDIDNNAGGTYNYDTLYSGVFSCAAYTHVWLSFDCWYGEYTNNNSGKTETASVAISTNGGSTWTTAELNPLSGGVWTTLVYDLSSLIGGQANVKIAFTYNDGGGNLVGMGLDNISVYSPAAYDVAVLTQNLPYYLQVNTPYNFSGFATDSGSNAITSMTMNYSANGGTPVSQNIAGIAGFNPLTAYSWSMNSTASAFTPSSAGTYTVKLWANTIDGANANANTDTLVTTFLAIDTVATKAAVYEEFTGQSCVWCMVAAPNCDSVATTNLAHSNIIRYHVPIPARDFMYNASDIGGSIDTRLNYYNVQGAPDGYLDGSELNPDAYQSTDPSQIYSSVSVQSENTIGSPIKIDITSATYDKSTNKFSVTANIHSYTAFAAGLTAQVALTIDSITYKYDLSMDDPQESFQPPIGTSTGGDVTGGAPDDWFIYVTQFPHVVEAMLPSNGNGTSLAAFVPGQTQVLNLSWTKNHAWATMDANPLQKDSDKYDSSATGQFVVFVQTNNAIGTIIPAGYVFQSASAKLNNLTGIQEVSIGNGVYFQMYPNPTNNNTNVAFKLDKNQHVSVEVYNMLGQNVYSDNEGNMSAGQHTISIDGSGLESGIYMVRFITDNITTTQKLVIHK